MDARRHCCLGLDHKTIMRKDTTTTHWFGFVYLCAVGAGVKNLYRHDILDHGGPYDALISSTNELYDE